MGKIPNTGVLSGGVLIDSDLSRIRPKNFQLDRERLFDDAIKQKIAANYLKDENLKLKTKVHILEGEI
jgi:hypothetical protein